MVRVTRGGSTLRQSAYARRVWGAEGTSRKEIALNVGYSMNVANSVTEKIEQRPGYHNAIAKLALESNNMAIAVMEEFKARGVKEFSDKNLIAALTAISGAWDRFNKGLVQMEKPPEDNGKNRLKTVILQRINTQINTPTPEKIEEVKKESQPQSDQEF